MFFEVADHMPIRAVTFDLWLTLIWDSEELEEYRRLRRLVNFHRFARRYATKEVLSNEEEEIKKRKFGFNEVRLALEELSLRVQSMYEKDIDVHPRDRGKMLFELLDIKLPRSEESEIYERAGEILSDAGYYKKYPHLNPEAKRTFKLLKENFPGIKIGLISNAARSSTTYKRMLRSFGIARYFDNLTISCEVGFLKPRKEIFERSLKALSLEPHEALHIGDLFKADVVGATSIGMHSALYTGLWHKYAQYMNPGEHIPKDFEPRTKVLVSEISKLQDSVDLVRKISSPLH